MKVGGGIGFVDGRKVPIITIISGAKPSCSAFRDKTAPVSPVGETDGCEVRVLRSFDADQRLRD